MIAIKIVSPYPLHAFGLAQLFNAEPEFRAVSTPDETPPDGDGYDLSVVVSNSPQAMRPCIEAEVGTIPVLVFGSSVTLTTIDDYFTFGVHGYVHCSASLRTLVSAVFAVAARHRYLYVDNLVDLDAAAGGDCSALSSRENQVLACIAAGLTHDQVARMLGISRHTVDTYVKRARKKLGLGNKADLTRAAMTHSMARQ